MSFGIPDSPSNPRRSLRQAADSLPVAVCIKHFLPLSFDYKGLLTWSEALASYDHLLYPVHMPYYKLPESQWFPVKPLHDRIEGSLLAAAHAFTGRLGQALPETDVRVSEIKIRVERSEDEDEITRALGLESIQRWHRDSDSIQENNRRTILVYLSEPVSPTEWANAGLQDACSADLVPATRPFEATIGSAFYMDKRICHRKPTNPVYPRLFMMVHIHLGYSDFVQDCWGERTFTQVDFNRSAELKFVREYNG